MSVENKIKIRDYQPGDEQGLVELLDIVFEGGPHLDIPCPSTEYWKWKYLDNPYKTKLMPVAEINGRIVGSNHGCTNEIKIYKNMYQSSQGTDLATHPDFRRMGIYRNISEFKTKKYKEQGYYLAYAVTGNPVVYESGMKWGRRGSPHKIITMIKVEDINLHLKKKQQKDYLIKKLGAQLISATNTARKLLRKKEYAQHDFSIEYIESFDEHFTVFWNKVRDDYDLIFDRNYKYMEWRYLDERAGRFTVISAKRGKEWLGYIVVRINNYIPDYSEAYIADILAYKTRKDVWSALIREANRLIKNQNVNVIYSWVAHGQSLVRVYEDEGYLNSRYTPFFIFHNLKLAEDWDNMYKIVPNRMHLQYGDSDWV